jgi:hypothetical protein
MTSIENSNDDAWLASLQLIHNDMILNDMLIVDNITFHPEKSCLRNMDGCT